MVVDDVENHREAMRVRRVDQGAEIVRCAIGTRGSI